MTAFPPDPRPIGFDQTYTSVDSPLGGAVGFEVAFYDGVFHHKIGQGWATWSHGYTGDVYRAEGAELTLTLPPDTGAFIFFAEPQPFQWYTIVATANDDTVVSQEVHGSSGAKGYGFWTDGSTPLESIHVKMSYSGTSMAVGEFSIAVVPEPATLLLAGVLALRRWR
jgi:hypothetical protein